MKTSLIVLFTVFVFFPSTLHFSHAQKQPFTFQDDFSAYEEGADGSPGWFSTSIGWAVKSGKFINDEPGKSFALVASAPYATEQTIEAIITIKEKIAPGWKIAGLVIFKDDNNYWHFALAEQPEEIGSGHFIELVEMYQGHWLGQNGEGTRLTCTEEVNMDFQWKYNQPYKIQIKLTPEGISGYLYELAGSLIAKKTYKFDNPAVTFGKAGLDNGGFLTEFDNFKVQARGEVKVPKEEKVFPEYEVKGWEGIKGKATGFFHTEKKDGIWWVIDPKGNGFYAVGTDHANYNAHWCEKLGYAPYHRNCVEKYKGDESAWAESVAKRLRSWNFNLLGAGCSPSVRYRGLAHTEFLSFGSGFASVDNIAPQVHWTGFPNVFSPKFKRYCDKRAQQLCQPNRKDPWLFGYFIDNELEWYGKTGRPWGLWDEVMKKPAEHTAKQAFVEFVKKRHKTIDRFNAAWGTKLKNFEDILKLNNLEEKQDSQQVIKDKMAFIRLIAEKYFSISAQAIRNYDPNHMILGCRFAGGVQDEVWEEAGKYCDIVTLNYYGRVDLETGEAPGFEEYLISRYKLTKKPLMITEWSFPALDSGLPCKHGAGMRVDTQEQKSQAFSVYQRLFFKLPFFVGSDYFMWVDEPALGISSTFPEDSNYGLVNEKDEPYTKLTETATKINATVYELHSGKTPELTVSDKDLKIIGDKIEIKVRNKGKREANFSVAITIDGPARKIYTEVEGLGAGKSQTLQFTAPELETPGCHFVLCQIDPEGKVGETNRKDNIASRVIYVPGVPWLPEGKTIWNNRIPIALYNLSVETSMPVVIKLKNLSAQIEWNKLSISRLKLVDGQTNEPIPFQIDDLDEVPGLSADDEIAFQVPPMAAGSRTLFLYLSKVEPPKESASEKETIEVTQSEQGFRINNGKLILDKSQPDGDLVNRVKIGELELGRFLPLVWQYDGVRNWWAAPDKVEEVRISQGPIRAVVDITTALTNIQAPVTPPIENAYKYRTKYCLSICPKRNWFSSQFLWLENTDSKEWTFNGYFHYALSNIGGSREGDEVGGPGVPNYYLNFGAWYDKNFDAYYGIVARSSQDFNITFWKGNGDPNTEHADCLRRTEIKLKPKERYQEPQPEAFIFAAIAKELEKPWAQIIKEIKALPSIRIFPVER